MTLSSSPQGPLVRPFPGLRPDPAHAADVVAPPYDVVSTEEARSLAAGRPHSFLHVSKPEIDLPDGTDPYAPEVYATGAAHLGRMIETGILRRDPSPCFYIYRVTMGGHVQTGIAAGGSVAAYDAGRIRRHEFTRPDKEDDRVRQIDAVNAQTGPVFTVHPPSPVLDSVIGRIVGTPPAYDVALGDTRHALWVVNGAEDIARIGAAFEVMERIYIADGHHRSAAASRVARDRAARAGSGSGPHPWESFLIVSFPSDQVRIWDYNRVIRDLNGLDRDAFIEAVGKVFVLAPMPEPEKPSALHQFAMYLDGAWTRLTLRQPPSASLSAVDRLDVSLLQDRLLGPVLGIEDPRTDKRIDFIGGIRGLAGLQARVDSGQAAVAFALFPTAPEELMAVADAGDVMPPKSTWFEPKLADGMVSLPLD